MIHLTKPNNYGVTAYTDDTDRDNGPQIMMRFTSKRYPDWASETKMSRELAIRLRNALNAALEER